MKMGHGKVQWWWRAAEGMLVRIGCYERDAETDVAKVLGARDKAKAGQRKKSDLGMVEAR